MISRQIFLQYSRLGRPLTNKIDKILATFELTLSQWRILAYLQNSGTSTLVGISNYFSIEKPFITRTITHLEKHQLVEQVVGKDKREKIVQLTGLGKEVYATCRNTLDEIELHLLNGITDEEQQIFLQTIFKIRDNLNKVVK